MKNTNVKVLKQDMLKLVSKMDINVILEYFDKLNDDNAMFIEFKNRGQLLVDNDDIIRVQGDLMEIKSQNGIYVVEISNVVGLKICNRLDLMRKVALGELIEELGDS